MSLVDPIAHPFDILWNELEQLAFLLGIGLFKGMSFKLLQSLIIVFESSVSLVIGHRERGQQLVLFRLVKCCWVGHDEVDLGVVWVGFST